MIRMTIRCRGAEEEVVFWEEEIITIGRSSKNNLQIPDNRASRKHCLIEKADKGYRIVDLGSRNGTQVNNRKIEAQPLQKGDRISTGEATLVVNDIAFGPQPKGGGAAPAQPGGTAVTVAKPLAARKRVGAGGITVRRGPREMPMGLLDWLLVLIIILLIIYIGGVFVFAAKSKGITDDLKRKTDEILDR
jgi:hypothetical protein